MLWSKTRPMSKLDDKFFSVDSLVGGKVKLFQPKSGYRVSIDSVLLSASVPASVGDRVLDLGSGVGAAALCLARRVGGCKIIGVEIQSDLIEFAQRNIIENKFNDRLKFFLGDIAKPLESIRNNSFDHVMANPPFFKIGEVVNSPYLSKNISKIENGVNISSWVDLGIRKLKRNGTITFIFRNDRLNEILQAFGRKIGNISIFPLVSKKGGQAKRVIVHGRKGGRIQVTKKTGIILHNKDGKFRKKTEKILRHGEQLFL